ncbi:MAG: Mrp/NBP35 family ATP-binding protein [Deltaproteobacteria bacterium]|nr:Mrp/NBP35 family ATP-binding protein [Deltaproteobacteria bacterium]
MITEEQVLNSLRTIQDPDLHQDIVTLGFIQNLTIDGGRVSFTINLTTPACPVREQFKRAATDAVKTIAGVTDVAIQMTATVRGTGRAPEQTALPGVKHIIAIASGKGGVGKSTLASNLACALQQTGATVGLLDADIYGPSQPKMLGTLNPPLSTTEDNQIIPWNQYGIKMMSMGFIVDDTTPVIWRGPMVHNILTQFVRQVAWGALDYLLIDLPPGTGDAQLTITQTVPLTGAVIVTTPQEVSIQIACKGLRMFSEVHVPVLGMVENMSYFLCGHCNERSPIFRHGGTRKACELHGVPFLGEVPIDATVTLDGDEGKPTVLAHPDSASAASYRAIAGQLAAQLSILTARSATGTEQPATSGCCGGH